MRLRGTTRRAACALFFGLFSFLNLIGELRTPGFDENIWWLDLRPLPAAATAIILALAGLLLVWWGVRPAAAGWRRVATSVTACALGFVAAAQRRHVLSRLAARADPAVDAAAAVVRAGGRAAVRRVGRGRGPRRCTAAAHAVVGRGRARSVRHPLPAGAAGLLRQDRLRATGPGGDRLRRPGAQRRPGFGLARRPRADGRAALPCGPHRAPSACPGLKVRASRSTKRR